MSADKENHEWTRRDTNGSNIPTETSGSNDE